MYIPNLTKYLKSKWNLKYRDNFLGYIDEFNTLDATEHIILNNFIMLIIIPFFPWIVIFGIFFMLFHFYHNLFILNKFRIP